MLILRGISQLYVPMYVCMYMCLRVFGCVHVHNIDNMSSRTKWYGQNDTDKMTRIKWYG